MTVTSDTGWRELRGEPGHGGWVTTERGERLPQGQHRQGVCSSAVPRTTGWRLRLGLFGGTFDPPHVGHLVTAVNVRHELGLDRVLLEVANRPWQKEGQRAISAAEDRFALVAAAVRGVEGLEASRMEIDRGGVSYTADTLAELERRHPGAELFTIVGSDAAAGSPDLGAVRRGGAALAPRRGGAPGQ